MRGSEVLRDGVGVLPSVAEFDELIAFRAGQGTTYTFHPSVIRDLLAEHHADRMEIDRLRGRVSELESALEEQGEALREEGARSRAYEQEAYDIWCAAQEYEW